VLTKTNYANWSLVMKVKLQARQMWDAVEYGGVDDHEDLRALEALLAAVPPEMVSVLAKKPTAKLAWEAIAQMRVGSDRARWSTLQKLRQEWDCLAFRPGEDIDDFSLRIASLMQKLEMFGDDDINEERAVEKLLRIVPDKYTQVALAVETMLDPSVLTIEEVTGRLKAIDDRKLSPAEPTTAGGKLLLTEEQWRARQGERKKGEASGSSRGFVKFRDTSAVEIEGAGSVVFVAKTGDHRMLPGVYYITSHRLLLEAGATSFSSTTSPATCGRSSSTPRQLLRMPSSVIKPLRRSVAASFVCCARTTAASSRRLSSRRTAPTGASSATTPCRTLRSRTVSSSAATRRWWPLLVPSSSRGGCRPSTEVRR